MNDPTLYPDTFEAVITRIIKEGGTAYPVALGAGNQFSGMTLRDHFAAQALGSITANDFALNNYIPSKIAEWAYQMADAMLAERAK